MILLEITADNIKIIGVICVGIITVVTRPKSFLDLL